MSTVHPDVAAILAAGRALGAKPFEELPPEEARIAHAARPPLLQMPPEDVAELRDTEIEGPGGAIPLRIYRGAGTKAGETLPCCVFAHGGGWVLGSIATHDGLARRFANEALCCVISVEYRLAPEHRFPAAIDDCAAAYAWAVREAAALAIDPKLMAVSGDSAGGNIAAVLALMSRDGILPPCAFQLLIYPATELGAASPSYEGPTEGRTITGATMRYFIDHYAPEPAQQADWRASPMRADSLAGVAPAFVLTCGHDPLRDEGRAYAERLEQEGVPVTALHLADQTHGMITMNKVLGAPDGAVRYAASCLREAWRVAAGKPPPGMAAHTRPAER